MRLLALLAAARALPDWSDETINTFIHCANESGPWSDDALARLVAQGPRFVVQERSTARWQAPVNASLEAKMLAAAQQIKRVAPEVQVLMYNPVFPNVLWYDYASRLEAEHPEYLIAWPNGTLFDHISEHFNSGAGQGEGGAP